MDARTFDRLVADVARPTRRGALRLAAAALLGGALTSRHLAPAAAQRADSDGDGLYDDDETGVYGTNPAVYDTDGDGSGDGEEIYYGTNPLDSTSYTEVVGNGNDVSAGNDGVGDAGTIMCFVTGTPCDFDTQCCSPGAALCCFDGGSMRTECMDVTAYGGACPG
jgi:hypothetical protein